MSIYGEGVDHVKTQSQLPIYRTRLDDVVEHVDSGFETERCWNYGTRLPPDHRSLSQSE